MKIEVRRVATVGESVLGLLFVDGVLEAFTEEGTETQIPCGTFKVDLRTDSPLSEHYAAMFPDMHKGMLWLRDVPGRSFIYLHIGNFPKDTEGCILLGDGASKDGPVTMSRKAYQRLYPRIASAVGGGVSCTVRWAV